jgi:hypothetical protein
MFSVCVVVQVWCVILPSNSSRVVCLVVNIPPASHQSRYPCAGIFSWLVDCTYRFHTKCKECSMLPGYGCEIDLVRVFHIVSCWPAIHANHPVSFKWISRPSVSYSVDAGFKYSPGCWLYWHDFRGFCSSRQANAVIVDVLGHCSGTTCRQGLNVATAFVRESARRESVVAEKCKRGVARSC